MDEKQLKQCWKCKSSKNMPDDFARNGADSCCKQCRYQLNSEWAKANREKLRPKRAEYMKNYRKAKKELAALEKTPPVGQPDPEK